MSTLHDKIRAVVNERGDPLVTWRTVNAGGDALDAGRCPLSTLAVPDDVGVQVLIGDESKASWHTVRATSPPPQTTAPPVATGALVAGGLDGQQKQTEGSVSVDTRQEANPLDRPLTATIFNSPAAADKTEEALSLREWAPMIRDATAPAKESLLWLKLATFGDQHTEKCSLRHDANVLTVTGIEADYDDERVTTAEAVAALRKAGLAALVYTSPSYTAERPRWRVLCPLAADLTGNTDELRARRAALVGRLNGVLGDVLTGESFALSQAFYWGSVNGNPAHRVELIDGDAIDLRDDLPAIGAPVRKAADVDFDWDRRLKPEQPQQPMTEDQIVAALNKDNRASRSEDAFAFINRLRREHNYTPREIVGTLLNHDGEPVMQRYTDEKAIRADVQRAFRKPDPNDRPERPVAEIWPEAIKKLREEAAAAVATGTVAVGGEEPDDEPEEADESWPDMVQRFQGWAPADGANLPPIAFLDAEKTLPITRDGCVLLRYGPQSSVKTAATMCDGMAAIKRHLDDPQHVPVVRVAYAVGEGVHGFLRQRVPAVANHFGIALDVLGRYWRTVPVPTLDNRREVKAFVCALAELFDGLPPTLLVLDTLATASGGVDENSAEIGKLLLSTGAIGKIKRRLAGPLVIVIDHEGKAENRGARGHSSKGGNADGIARYAFDKDTRALTVEIEKLRDAADGFTLEYRVSPPGSVPIVTLVGRADRMAPGVQKRPADVVMVIKALEALGAVDQKHAVSRQVLAEELAMRGKPESDHGRRTAEGMWTQTLRDGTRYKRPRFEGCFAKMANPHGASTKLDDWWYLWPGVASAPEPAEPF